MANSDEIQKEQNVTDVTDEFTDVLPLKNMVLFPGVMLSITVSRNATKTLVRNAYRQNQHIAVCTQKDGQIEAPKADDLYKTGSIAAIIKLTEKEDNNLEVLLGGTYRIKIEDISAARGTVRGHVIKSTEETHLQGDLNQILGQKSATLRELALKIIQKTNNSVEIAATLRRIDNPLTLMNVIGSLFDFTLAEKQELLECDLIEERADLLEKKLLETLERLEAKEEIENKTREEINKDQRKYYLHQQLEAIHKELGDTGQETIKELQEKAANKKWNEKIKKVFEEQLKRLQRFPSHSPDYATQQDYLETLLDLPWNEYTEDNYDIKHARDVLNHDHYGLEKVKERILEYLAVLKQTSTQTDAQFKAPILCLYGPPGVGKTSLGKSIAEALGRKYARISLGGLHDEAEIRGHRRTYLGALPGRIIENIRKVKSSNPVFVLDEIDKIGSDYKGDPTSALLEVLDPEQNTTFHDNYLNVDFDLSHVLFIATANTLDSIPRPLLDRMELVEMSGYLMEEKEEIAKRHLIPKEIERHGLTPEQIQFDTHIIDHLIDDYTRESGVRNLSRQIATICRKVVTRIALEETYNVQLTQEDLIQYLGQPRYMRDAWETNKYIGVVTGLAWTQVGGEILFIETSLSPSKQPTLTLTGNLGDVMKESATIALAYIKAHAKEFDIKQKDLETHSVHVHVPEGAIPKDGPSAGITMTTALVSAFTGRKVRPRIAMTGEMTLRGKVLPIGGVKEKILAAKRAGITDLVLCQENKKDVVEIPEAYLKGLTFHYVSDIKEVIDYSLL